MADKYDTEDLLDTVLNIMVTGGALNAKIAAIEAEKVAKGKGINPTLKPVATGSYYLQAWNEKILNTSPAIFYGLEDIAKTESVGNVVAREYKLFVEVVVVDSGMTNDSSKRIMRYARALEELFAENFSPAVAQGQVKIEAVRPAAFKLALDSDEEVKVSGVLLSINMA